MGQIIITKDVITRKEHSCWGCMRTFPAKTKMEVSVCVDDGALLRTYHCKDCRDFMNTLDPYDLEYGFCEGDLLNYEEYAEKLNAAACI